MRKVMIFLFAMLSLSAVQAQELYAQMREGRYVELRWQGDGGSYELWRRMPDDADFGFLAESSARVYRDTIRYSVCGDSLLYQLRRGAAVLSQVSVWFKDGVYPEGCAIQLVTTDTLTGVIHVSWDPSASNDVMAYIVCKGSPCVDPDTVFTTQYTLDSADEVVTFRVFPVDSCANPGPISKPCNNILLSVSPDKCGGTFSASWNAYINLPGTMQEYELQMRDADGGWIQVASTSQLQHRKMQLPSDSDSCEFRIMLPANTDTIYSNTAWAYISQAVWTPCRNDDDGGRGSNAAGQLPNAIIPSQAPNNLFCPQNSLPGNTKDYQCNVYNRMGKRVFHSETPSECFDGTYKGKPLAQGAYAYLILYTRNGEQAVLKGTLMIIR